MTTGPNTSIGLADLATNVLAVVIIAFVALASSPRGTPQTEESFRAIMESIVEHRPLLPNDMIDQLESRAGKGEGLIIEATASGIRQIGPRGQVISPPLATGATGKPVRLFVFSNAHYSEARHLLKGRDIRELSVPDALKSGDGQNWSEGFLSLIATASDRESFRNGLAALLDATTRPPRSAETGAGSASAATILAGMTAWREWLRLILLVLMPVAAVLVIAKTERRVS